MLQLNHVRKEFDNGVVALADVSLHLRAGEIVTLVGASGCGKSTLLRLVAGLEAPSAGSLVLAEQKITQPNPAVGVIFQEPRLMPWLTVQENVCFGLRHLPPAERAARAAAVLARVGLSAFAGALPRQLSGGMAQRVAIARALVTRPALLLLDEPFSALDPFTKASLHAHLLDVWADTRPTLLLVTHDVEEALVLSDRVVVLHGHPGRISQTLALDLPRPRRPTSPAFQAWKQRILQAIATKELALG